MLYSQVLRPYCRNIVNAEQAAEARHLTEQTAADARRTQERRDEQARRNEEQASEARRAQELRDEQARRKAEQAAEARRVTEQAAAAADAHRQAEACRAQERRGREHTCNPQDPCDHTNYSGYKQESNADYCAEGELFGGRKCCGVQLDDDGATESCDKHFVNKRGLAGFFPSGDKPIWHCKNIKRGGTCMHALCHDCYVQELSKGGNSRRSRKRNSKFDE